MVRKCIPKGLGILRSRLAAVGVGRCNDKTPQPEACATRMKNIRRTISHDWNDSGILVGVPSKLICLFFVWMIAAAQPFSAQAQSTQAPAEPVQPAPQTSTPVPQQTLPAPPPP